MSRCDWPSLITPYPLCQVLEPGGRVRLVCQADSYYEYCSWRHTNTPYNRNKGVRECHFEWKRKHVSRLENICERA